MNADHTSTVTLFDQIGAAFIARAVSEFYERAFVDPIIGHFFFNRDRSHLVREQTAFATALLGGPRTYSGKPLLEVHQPLAIRPPHFGRRQVLMAEVLTDLGLDPDLKSQWLAREINLRPLIVRG